MLTATPLFVLTPEPGWIFQGERQSCGISLPQVAGDERNLGLPITSHLSTRAGKVILVINTCSADTQNGFFKIFILIPLAVFFLLFFLPSTLCDFQKKKQENFKEKRILEAVKQKDECIADISHCCGLFSLTFSLPSLEPSHLTLLNPAQN